MDQVGVVDLEGLADVLNGNGEDGGTYRDLHAVHDRHGQGDLQRCGHSPAGITGDDHRAAHVLHIPLDHIHANAAAGMMTSLPVCRADRMISPTGSFPASIRS